MGGVAAYLLSGGLLDADRSVIHPGDVSGRRVVLPVYQVLLEVEGQRILIDTGLPPVTVDDSHALKRDYDIDPGWIKSMAEPDQGIEQQLGALGLRPSDIDLVVATHLHFDHAGGNCLFPDVPIAVQRAELEAARDEEYLRVWDAPGVIFNSVEGDWSPAPGIEFLHTPGHSLGHQSLLIRTAEKPWLFTFDAVYTEEHWRARHLGAVRDVPAARESLKRLRVLVAQEHSQAGMSSKDSRGRTSASPGHGRTGLRIVFGHDLAQWESLTGGASRGPWQIIDE